MSTSKTILEPIVLVNNQAISANFTSNPFSIARFSRATVEIIFTGTLTGTVQVQTSGDYVPPTKVISPSINPASWYDSPLSFAALSGTGDSYFIDWSYSGVPWIRVNFTYAAGAGNISVVITGKES